MGLHSKSILIIVIDLLLKARGHINLWEKSIINRFTSNRQLDSSDLLYHVIQGGRLCFLHSFLTFNHNFKAELMEVFFSMHCFVLIPLHCITSHFFLIGFN